jgi:CRP-like cAMP-binding protein
MGEFRYIYHPGSVISISSTSGMFEPFFRYCANFQSIDPESRAALEDICSIRVVEKNRDLQPIGHTCRTVYFINKGIARIYYFKDDTDITESFAFENQLVVRYESLFTGRPSRKAIQVLEDTELVAIDAGRLFQLYDSNHDIERLFRKMFEAAHVETINRIEGIQFHSAAERYHALLQEAPDIIRRVPLKYIASYLGITQVSLSRIRARR